MNLCDRIVFQIIPIILCALLLTILILAGIRIPAELNKKSNQTTVQPQTCVVELKYRGDLGGTVSHKINGVVKQ